MKKLYVWVDKREKYSFSYELYEFDEKVGHPTATPKKGFSIMETPNMDGELIFLLFGSKNSPFLREFLSLNNAMREGVHKQQEQDKIDRLKSV